MKRPRQSVTQSEIARKAGVSQTAVSAILSGSTSLNVSEDTRTSVLALAAELGYSARRSGAKAVASGGRRRTVLIVQDQVTGPTTNEQWVHDGYRSFMSRILEVSGESLQTHGIGMSVIYLSNAQQLTQWLADSDVVGVLWHADDSDAALLHWVASRFPLVLLNREWRSAVPFDSVSVDQEQAIIVAGEYLWAHGHRRIATFGNNALFSVYRRRLIAYQRFVEERAVRNYTEFQEIPDEVGAPALPKVEAILDTWAGLGRDAPTALITNDSFALILLREAQKRGIRIPDDLSVVGIDNTTPCAYVHPSLSSMAGSTDEMCRVAVDLLLRRTADAAAPAQTVQIAPKLIVRESIHTLAPGGAKHVSALS